MSTQHIGIMGGSFNPIHERHVEMALCAMRELCFDKLLFVPSGNPPHKREGLADAEDRFEMTRLAVYSVPGAQASRIEIDREGVIYTVDTLRLLKQADPQADLTFIIGEDTLKDLPNWRTPDEVFKLCDFAVCCRDTDAPQSLPVVRELEARGAKFHYLALPPSPVSSTSIREQLMQTGSADALAPQVLAYIRAHGLYGVPAMPNGREIYADLKTTLSPHRLLHSLSVSDTARRLALLHGADAALAEQAGLLHDCAKGLSLDEMQQIASAHRLVCDKATYYNGNLLHGPVGALLAEEQYGFTDPDALRAIVCHTTGREGMNTLDMILFLSDKIEPGRKPYDGLEELRTLSRQDLPAACIRSLESSVRYVLAKGETPHPGTLRTIERLRKDRAACRT